MQTIRITTSQNIDIDYEIAGLGARIAALLIDLAIFFSIYIAAIFVTLLFSALRGNTIVIMVLIIAYFTLYVFYDLLCEVFMNGQSIGKRVMKIKVISADGGRPTLGQYLLRWLFRIVDFTMTGGICALITAAVSEKSQRVGDMVAGTVLVRTEPTTRMDAIAFTPPPDQNYTARFPEAAQLKDKDIALIHEVLANYIQSGNSVILYNTAAKLKQVLNIQTEMEDMRFLQTLIKDYNHIVAAMGSDEMA